MAAQRPGHGLCVVMLPSRPVQLQKLDLWLPMASGRCLQKFIICWEEISIL